jgi:hypothetical protein
MGRASSLGDDRMIESAQSSINTRRDLVDFLTTLRQDLRDNRGGWENDTLESYLEAFQAVLSDWEGRFVNRGEPVPQDPTWRLLGEMLVAATIYE